MQRALFNARSIATHLGDIVTAENAKIAPKTLSMDEILVLIGRGKGVLELTLLEELAQYAPYSEGLRPTSAMRRLINMLGVLDSENGD